MPRFLRTARGGGIVSAAIIDSYTPGANPDDEIDIEFVRAADIIPRRQTLILRVYRSERTSSSSKQITLP